MKGDGSIGKPIISENVLKINFQKLYKLGHVQNICKRFAGACLHLSQIGSSLGRNLDNLRPVEYFM